MGYGILEPSQDRRIIFVTSLFRSLGQRWLVEHGKRASVEELALQSILDKFTGDAREPLLPCALAVSRFKPTSAEGDLHLATLMSKVSEYYMDLQEPKKALKTLKKCLSLREKHSDPDSDTRKGLVQETKQAIEKAGVLAAQMKKNVSHPSKTTRQFDEEKQFLELERAMPNGTTAIWFERPATSLPAGWPRVNTTGLIAQLQCTNASSVG